MEEVINYKKEISKYVREAEMFFPPDWSYSKIYLFRNLLNKILLKESELLQEQNIAMKDAAFVLETAANWCSWCYIDAEVLCLSDENLEKLFQSIANISITTFLVSLEKNRSQEEYTEIIDKIIHEKFENAVNVYLSKGIIAKHQAQYALRCNAKEQAGVNIDFNKENREKLFLLVSIISIVSVIFNFIMTFVCKMSVFAAIFVAIVVALICYWIYMLLCNWRLNRQERELIDLKCASLGIGNGASTSIQPNKGGNGNEEQVKSETSCFVTKDVKGQVYSTGMSGSVTLLLGNGLIPYVVEYSEGTLPVLIAQLRNKLIKLYNFELPPVELNNYSNAGDYDYKILIQRKEVMSGTLSGNKDTLMEELISKIETSIVNNLEKIRK